MRLLRSGVAMLALWPVTAWADDVFTLGQVDVVAPAPEGETSLSSTVTADDIRQFNKQTIGEALNMLPGVMYTTSGRRNEGQINIRGFDVRQVPVLIDGIPVSVPYDGYVDFNRFTTADVSSIQVTKTMTSVLVGPNAMGGVVNIVGRRPTRPLEGELTTRANFDSAGAFGGWSTSLSGGAKTDDLWGQVGVSFYDQDHTRLPHSYRQEGPNNRENGGNRNGSSARDYKVNLKVGWTPSGEDEYTLNVISQRGRKDTGVYAGTGTSGNFDVWKWPKWDKDSVYWLSNTAIGDNSYVKTRAFYDNFRNQLDMFDPVTLVQKGASEYDDYNWGGSVEAGSHWTDWNTLKGAIHYKKSHHKAFDNVAGQPDQKTDEQLWSFAVEDTVHIGEQWTIIAGLSYDLRLGGQAQNWDTTLNKIIDYQGKDDHSVNPQLAAVYQFSSTGQAHAAIAQRSRFPTLKDMYSSRFGRTEANPSLKSEQATLYELGVTEQFWGHTRVDASVFYNDIRDAIDSVEISPRLSQFQNLGTVESKGIELSLRTYIIDNTELGLNYSYLDAYNRTRRAVPTRSPRNKLFGFARYDLSEAFYLQATVEHQSKQASSIGGSIEAGTMVKGFTTTGIKAHWQALDTVAAEVGVNNLFDARYQFNDGYPEPGRTFFTTLRVTF